MKTKNYKFIISTTSILINNKINRIFVRLIVNFHEALNESSINIQRTMEKAIPFIRKWRISVPIDENLEKLFDCCESIIPPGHYPIFHSFMYRSCYLSQRGNCYPVIILYWHSNFIPR